MYYVDVGFLAFFWYFWRRVSPSHPGKAVRHVRLRQPLRNTEAAAAAPARTPTISINPLTPSQVKMKQLVIADLSKRCNDTNNRLKEFSALYDVVKNERNKYVNLIQASHQALAEMKEKIKILHNEVRKLFT